MCENRNYASSAKYLEELNQVLLNFGELLGDGSLREHVLRFLPATDRLREVGASLIDPQLQWAGKERVLQYLRAHAGEVVDSNELLVVSGIGDYPRRIRELRKEAGWPILSGVTVKELRDAAKEAGVEDADNELPPKMRPDQYLLLEDKQDKEAAHRWHIANDLRRRKGLGVKKKLLEYFLQNIGSPINSEELRYLANDKSEWARRTRELRTEDGWAIVTKFNGNPNLPTGVYILAHDRQAPTHDRRIKEIVRREVMQRDNYSCRWKGCGWNKQRYDKDPRFLEVHHIEHHARGGRNTPDNLVTLCNLHHDEVHRSGSLEID